jgi:hypothetical protein
MHVGAHPATRSRAPQNFFWKMIPAASYVARNVHPAMNAKVRKCVNAL